MYIYVTGCHALGCDDPSLRLSSVSRRSFIRTGKSAVAITLSPVFASGVCSVSIATVGRTGGIRNGKEGEVSENVK